MYVEGADTPGSETDSHDAAHMEVEVSAGHEQSLELNYDADHDGVNDSALVHGDHGYMAFSDADHDGHADHMVQLDENGHVTGTAHFDNGTHSWVADDQSASSLGSNAEHASGLVVETDHGNVVAGPATVDLNHDGRADTAIVHDDQGRTIMYTDTNGDGVADKATIMDANGDVTVQESHDHHWVNVEKGHLDDQGHYEKTSHLAEGVARIDPETGQWISNN